jgi:hypothetical protein
MHLEKSKYLIIWKPVQYDKWRSFNCYYENVLFHEAHITHTELPINLSPLDKKYSLFQTGYRSTSLRYDIVAETPLHICEN